MSTFDFLGQQQGVASNAPPEEKSGLFRIEASTRDRDAISISSLAQLLVVCGYLHLVGSVLVALFAGSLMVPSFSRQFSQDESSMILLFFQAVVLAIYCSAATIGCFSASALIRLRVRGIRAVEDVSRQLGQVPQVNPGRNSEGVGA
jgi:hypothetical protein